MVGGGGGGHIKFYPYKKEGSRKWWVCVWVGVWVGGWVGGCMCVGVWVCVCVCLRACLRACVRACVCVCVTSDLDLSIAILKDAMGHPSNENSIGQFKMVYNNTKIDLKREIL